MSIRDAARIAALETRVSELSARIEKIELAVEAPAEDESAKPKKATTPRRWRN